MLTKRIIPCLDIRDGKTVKGINFVDIREAGDPVELGQAYADQGADELVFLDITATIEKRATFAKLVKKIACYINIPFTVGGGICTVEDVEVLLDSGADKISVNSAAVKEPDLLNQLSENFGSQCVVLAIDTFFDEKYWKVYVHGGRTPTELYTESWAIEAVKRGAGEILLTSMNHDGTKKGFALDITSSLSEKLSVPIIASGGAGNSSHFVDAFTTGKADAALAASIFHFGEIKIPDLKLDLFEKGVNVRIA
ncbi:MAG: imidazole glycerol phosphate synthase subunit HisF [Calditrichaeota bacterium]|nr:MAG: imidazole glycerol phosphate synthase subunit HisF [Calditrichota bacterium]MBL1205615.1 imidazole glycerol phosphate synthase subunit HisF [Calditrichota bacterium]NOG45443.1 imidazole glycerol phosphate synthase subunit HisF [Calditrichota bacterium]